MGANSASKDGRVVNELSLFEQALEPAVGGARVEDLGCVYNVSRRTYEEKATFTFRAQAPCIEYLSLLVENALLLGAHRAGRVYAGFGKLSRMEPVADRYLRIADLSERLYVFGEADWKPPRHPNMRVLPVAPGSTLAHECFIVADSPLLHVSLIAVDTDDSGAVAPTHETRAFHAIKSSDPAVVSQLAAAIERLIDASLAA